MSAIVRCISCDPMVYDRFLMTHQSHTGCQEVSLDQLDSLKGVKLMSLFSAL